jgi:IS5 family transposase
MKKWEKTMYKPTRGQMTLFDQPIAFAGAKLSPDNRWVKMASLIPWDLLDRKYSEQFGSKTGYPAKAARMALGSHIIKEKFRLSDEETVEHIKESPYLQWFIGLPAFTDKAPFDASTMTWFRKRLTPEMLAEVNAYVIGSKKKDDDEDPMNGSDSSDGGGDSESEEGKNKGTLILDATCAPADIKYPTDVALLNTAREKLERMITELHGQTSQKKKPRTYKRIARKDYLRFARNRKPTIKTIRKAIRQQLGYVRRDLAIIETLLQSGLNLTEKSEGILHIIKTLYSQQEEMCREKKHQVEDRIVSIHQPWVRPIVRGKTNAPTEFGAKIAISMVDGYASVERLDWNAFNETSTLQESVERYREERGYYPERILADKIYRTRENLSFCSKHGIRMNGPKLGRPPKDKKAYRLQCLLEKSEAGERNAVEGKFGEGKRAYGLNRIFTRRQDTSETSIHLVFLVMNMEKRLRSLLLPILEVLENMISMLKIIKNRALIGA